MIYPEKRPSWWDETHRLVRHLSEINQEKPLSQSDILSVRAVARKIIEIGDPIQSMMFLKLLSEFIFIGAKRIFFDVLNDLRQSHPEIASYFQDVDVDDREEGPVFTPLAMDRIFRFFEEEYGYPQGVLSSKPLSELPRLVDRMMHEGAERDMAGWVIVNDLMRDDPHVVPVFTIKQSKRTHVFIFDSTGHNFSTNPYDQKISAALEELIKHFKDSEGVSGLLSIYSYKTKRQNSDLGCGTFSTMDLKNLLERHTNGMESLVDFYQAQSPDLQPRPAAHELDPSLTLPIYELTTLPPEMMKVTQSLRGIESYRKTSPVSFSPPFVERFTPSWSTCLKIQDMSGLTASVAEIQRFDESDRPKNLYVDQKRLQFIVYLLSLHFGDLPHSLPVRRVLFPQGLEEEKGSPRSPLPPLPFPELDVPAIEDEGEGSDALLTPLPGTSRGQPDLGLMQVSDFDGDDGDFP